MGQPPGTVSKILWHFTGGPAWNTVENCQGSKPKAREDAYKALLSILKSKQLRLGNYREVAKVRVPKLRRYNKVTRKTEVRRNTIVEIASSQVAAYPTSRWPTSRTTPRGTERSLSGFTATQLCNMDSTQFSTLFTALTCSAP